MDAVTWALLATAALLVAYNWYKSYLQEKAEEERIEMEIRTQKLKAENRKKLYRDMSTKELRQYNGENDQPIFLATRDIIFDVTTNPGSYGPDGGYGVFGGRDASRGLGKMSLDDEDCDVRDISDLTAYEVETLDQWIRMFLHKYPIVGRLTDSVCGKVPQEWIEQMKDEKARGIDRSILPGGLDDDNDGTS
mmetsp:Transcript_1459/g.2074  ORF Transcript_1459/g.2074 Transcript_1459/m.2074 type:complete len:192 (+) Transcript_1459:31-606(+)